MYTFRQKLVGKIRVCLRGVHEVMSCTDSRRAWPAIYTSQHMQSGLVSVRCICGRPDGDIVGGWYKPTWTRGDNFIELELTYTHRACSRCDSKSVRLTDCQEKRNCSEAPCVTYVLGRLRPDLRKDRGNPSCQRALLWNRAPVPVTIRERGSAHGLMRSLNAVGNAQEDP